MARTSSILTEADWKRTFGNLLKTIAEEQRIRPEDIGRRLDRIEGSTGRNRVGDWSRYVNKGRIPSEAQLEPLAAVLRVPLPIMRVCSGYVDGIFECSYAIMFGDVALPKLRCPKTRAVFAFLFSLFPNEEMHTGNLCELWSFIAGRPVRLNLTPDDGVLTGRDWNSTWLYPRYFKRTDLIANRCNPKKDGVIGIAIDGAKFKAVTKPWTYYTLRSRIQTDIASPLAAAILACKRKPIPKTDLLYSAQRLIHTKTMPLLLRTELVTTTIHHWADKIDQRTADEVRRDLNYHDEKTITPAAVKWIRRGAKPEDRPEHGDFWR